MQWQSTRAWLSFAVFGGWFVGAAVAAVAMGFRTHSAGTVPHIIFGVGSFLFFLVLYAVLQSSKRPLGFILTGLGILVGGSLWAVLSQPTSFMAAALVIGCLLAGTSRKAELIHATWATPDHEGEGQEDTEKTVNAVEIEEV